jgi:hypothetical protein
LQVAQVEMRIQHRRINPVVAEQPLNVAEVCAVPQLARISQRIEQQRFAAPRAAVRKMIGAMPT